MARAAGKQVSEAVMHLIYRFSFPEVPTILFVISVYCLCSLVAGLFGLFGFLSEKHFDLWGSCCSVFLGGVQEFHVLINRFFDVPFTGAPDQRFETVFLSSLYGDVPCHWGRGEKRSDCKSAGCAVYRSFMFHIKAKELEMSPAQSPFFFWFCLQRFSVTIRV
jgi:hypothetical protein